MFARIILWMRVVYRQLNNTFKRGTMSFFKRWLKRFIDVHYNTVQSWLNDQKNPVDQEYLKGYEDGKHSRLFAHSKTSGDIGRDRSRAYEQGYTAGRDVWFRAKLARLAAERKQRQAIVEQRILRRNDSG